MRMKILLLGYIYRTKYHLLILNVFILATFLFEDIFSTCISSFSGHPSLLAPSPAVTDTAQWLQVGGVFCFSLALIYSGDRLGALQLYTEVYYSCGVTLGTS